MTVDEVYDRIDTICRSGQPDVDIEDELVALISSLDFTNLQKFMILSYLEAQYGIKLSIPGIVKPRISYN